MSYWDYTMMMVGYFTTGCLLAVAFVWCVDKAREFVNPNKDNYNG